MKNKKLNKKETPLIKNKITGITQTGGRNNSGKITIRHKGKGHKKKYRHINFHRTLESTGIIYGIEYDPNRNANIASVFDFWTKKFFYIIAPKNLKPGDIVKSGSNIEPKLGYSLTISRISVGSYIYNISSSSLKSGQLSRAAGTFAVVKEKTLNYVKIELSSGKQKIVSTKCYASIGIVSNETIFFSKMRKAGQSRWLGRRPSVRGVAMNPIDHPHGGGEGKKSGKGMTPWGKPVKGLKF